MNNNERIKAVGLDHIVTNAVERSKLEILSDIDAGIVPTTVRTFSELHDFVDANEYGGLCEDLFDQIAQGEENYGVDLVNEIQDAVHDWLAAGRPVLVH